MCVPTTAIGRPTLDPWVQASIDFFCNTHVCVLPAAIGLPKLLNVQNLHLTSSLDSCATHMCVFTTAIGRPTLRWSLLQHMCAYADSNNRSARVVNMVTASIDFFCTRHVCIQKHTSVCAQQQWVDQPLTLGCNSQWTSSATHVCICSQQQSVCPSC